LSEIRATTISDAAGTGPITLTKQSAAKAWVNFDGTGTIAARGSFNVSSLTDNSTGNYNVNLTNSMSNTSYCWSGISNNFHDATSTVLTTSSFNLQSYNSSHASVDVNLFNTTVHGDLA
jgi:hypothetical protein